MRLGAKLRELRERRGETQREVADAVGVSRYMIIRLERDQFKRSTSTTVIARLADYFGVSVDEMLGVSPDDHVPDVESMLRRAARLDARDRVLLDRIIRLMVDHGRNAGFAQWLACPAIVQRQNCHTLSSVPLIVE